MSIESEIKIIKENYIDKVIFVKIGSFFHSYNKDAYIVSYLFDYQLKKTNSGNSDVGFPVSTLDNILDKMKREQISYVVMSSKFDIETEKDFEEQNRYLEISKKSYQYIVRKGKVEELHRILMERLYDENIMEVLSKLENIIYQEFL